MRSSPGALSLTGWVNFVSFALLRWEVLNQILAGASCLREDR